MKFIRKYVTIFFLSWLPPSGGVRLWQNLNIFFGKCHKMNPNKVPAGLDTFGWDWNHYAHPKSVPRKTSKIIPILWGDHHGQNLLLLLWIATSNFISVVFGDRFKRFWNFLMIIYVIWHKSFVVLLYNTCFEIPGGWKQMRSFESLGLNIWIKLFQRWLRGGRFQMDWKFWWRRPIENGLKVGGGTDFKSFESLGGVDRLKMV